MSFKVQNDSWCKFYAFITIACKRGKNDRNMNKESKVKSGFKKWGICVFCGYENSAVQFMCIGYTRGGFVIYRINIAK